MSLKTNRPTESILIQFGKFHSVVTGRTPIIAAAALVLALLMAKAFGVAI